MSAILTNATFIGNFSDCPLVNVKLKRYNYYNNKILRISITATNFKSPRLAKAQI